MRYFLRCRTLYDSCYICSRTNLLLVPENLKKISYIFPAQYEFKINALLLLLVSCSFNINKERKQQKKKLSSFSGASGLR